MTVRELMIELAKYDLEASVYFDYADDAHSPIDIVEKFEDYVLLAEK